MKKQQLFRSILLSLSLLALQTGHASVDEIIRTFHDASNPRILVMAHRAGYLSGSHLPENSLPALERSLDRGMDIIETDFRLTADGHMVAMHDPTIDRTTNGTGPLSDLTLEEVRKLRLRLPDGTLTDEYPPTLDEFAEKIKGRAMLILDKVNVADEAQMKAVMPVLRKHDVIDHIFFHGTHEPDQAVKALSRYPEKLNYMPQRRNTTAEEIITVLEALKPPGIELIFKDEQTPMLSQEVIETARKTDTRIWINALWADQNGGRHDDRAMAGEEEEAWGWIADQGALIIQSDHSKSLQSFLEERDGTATIITHNLSPAGLNGWTRVSSAYADEGFAFYPTSSSFSNRIEWGGPEESEGGVIVTDAQGTADWRARAHASAILRSPTFTLKGTSPDSSLSSESQVEKISFSPLGGMGAVAGPASFSDIPEQSVRQSNRTYNGWLGVALRRHSDNQYLIWGRRSANGQSNIGPGWQMIQWDDATLAEATAEDPPGTLYTLDLIDAAHDDWGWVALNRIRFRLAGTNQNNSASSFR